MGMSGDVRKLACARLAQLLSDQDGVIARRQVIECGLGSAYVRQRLRRRDWVAVYPGIYVAHTGPLTDRQREWSAVLYAFPAALSHESAVRAASSTRGEPRPGPVHIVVDAGRRLVRQPGIVLHYSRHLSDRVAAHAMPPRIRLEHAVLDVASEATSDFAAIACLSGVVQARLTTPDRLLEALDSRSRTARRSFLEGVLNDVRDGTCSVLEHRYLRDVERAHGLPTSSRQTQTGVGRRGFRDVEYEEWGLIVELDGRAHHDDARARDADLERDLDAFVFADKPSIRLGWGQVIDRTCRTAGKVGAALNRRGWPGRVATCSPSCTAESSCRIP
ncbi:MAG: type IV toxin-antitoxin system AbiEi family antitoxin domain-containing protein [Gordonia sp. (in: high G+C Gram-positive bacteria)]|uniref:hypothetical protein n=1 Tax=Gordonia sp. (in: high G+C Gram-positive bacteria) TaxID=84139 RepID=UPI003C71650F